MKILVVTSQTTYMPGNYIDLLEALIKSAQQSYKSEDTKPWKISAIASVKTLDKSLLKSVVGLPFLGVYQLTETLITNILELPFKKRDRLAARFKIPHIKCNSMNEKWVIEKVKELDIDIILNIRTRCIYRKEILAAPNLGCINIHHGLLPNYRGTFCDLYALYEGRSAGFSLHEMVSKIDAGKIFDVVTVDQGQERNYRNYLKKTIQYEIDTLNQFFHKCAQIGELPMGKPNTPKNKCYTKNPTRNLIKKFKKEGLIL